VLERNLLPAIAACLPGQPQIPAPSVNSSLWTPSASQIRNPHRRFDLVPARANGQPAFGAYLRTPAGIRHGTGLYVLTLAGDRICALTRFDNSVLPWFGLPRSLPGR
jgi:hypothetical protein